MLSRLASLFDSIRLSPSLAMPSVREITAFHKGVDLDGRRLTPADRERLLKPYLPTVRSEHSPSKAAPKVPGPTRGVITKSKSRHTRLRARSRLASFIRSIIHRLLYFIIQLVFSVYIRIRQTYHAVHDRLLGLLYYHHRTPELIQKDLKNLNRLPKHLSVIVELKEHGSGGEIENLSKLIEDVAEVSAWCACAGIPLLSVYERTGVLKHNIPSLHRVITATFRSYFPPDSTPPLHIRAPHHPAFSPLNTPPSDKDTSPTISDTPAGLAPKPLNVLLLSASDGRATLVDLTKTLVEMAQRGKLAPSDISSDLIDAEISESVSSEPDLLVVMAPSVYRDIPGLPRSGKPSGRRRSSGSRSRRRGRSRSRSGGLVGKVDGSGREGLQKDTDALVESVGASGDLCLRGYPPWQVRLTEIFHVTDNEGVGYQIFLQALHRYAEAEMRVGR